MLNTYYGGKKLPFLGPPIVWICCCGSRSKFGPEESGTSPNLGAEDPARPRSLKLFYKLKTLSILHCLLNVNK